MAMEGMLHLHNSPACEALSAWVEATGEEVPMPAETEGSSGGVQPGVSVTGESREGCAPAAAVAAGKAMGASAAADAALVGLAASGPGALCGSHLVLLEVLLERPWPCDWVTKQRTSGLVEDVGVRDATAAVDGDAAELHSLGRLLSGREPLGLETDAARQGSYPHQLPNPHWVGGPAGEEACPQG